ncbi:MAG: PAC2 family protein [Candidatus Lokiarchaeota archaeon]|nr:PAC2 family protein [Candidatus Lokiarchaeota archaeon]
MEGIRIIKHENMDEKDFIRPICILGMPGIADVGKFALDSLIGQLNALNLIDIIFDDYPAGAIVDDSLLSAPKAEILYWKDPNELRDIVLITADAQSLTPKGIYKISNFLTEIIHQFGIKLIIALGAYPINSRKITSKLPKIYLSSTNRELLKHYLNESNCQKIQKGVIIGANGLIPTLAKARFNIDGLVFLAETDNIAMINEDITDLKASITLLEMLIKSFTLPIKKKYSLENIEEITKNLQVKRDQLEKDLDSLQLIETDDKQKSLYI